MLLAIWVMNMVLPTFCLPAMIVRSVGCTPPENALSKVSIPKGMGRNNGAGRLASLAVNPLDTLERGCGVFMLLGRTLASVLLLGVTLSPQLKRGSLFFFELISGYAWVRAAPRIDQSVRRSCLDQCVVESRYLGIKG
jgi:hypothetical protein